jgi:Co/Zn/Cd efflux system component
MIFSLLQLLCDVISLYWFMHHFGRQSMMEAFFIKDLKDYNMNLVSAYLHVLMDTVRSTITLTTAVLSKVMHFTNSQNTQMDAYISIALCSVCLVLLGPSIRTLYIYYIV